MPNEAIEISTSVESLPQVRDTAEALCIIGYSDSGDASEGDLEQVQSSGDAEAYFGEDTPLTNALQEAIAQGSSIVYGYKVPFEEQTETIDAGSTETLSENISYIGGNFTVSSGDVFATYDSDPSSFSDDMSDGEAVVNTNTGDIYISGSSTDIDVTYDAVPWEDTLGDLEQTVIGKLSDYDEIGIIAMAGMHSNTEHQDTSSETVDLSGVYNTDEAFQYGDKVNMNDIAGSLRCIMVLPVYGYENAVTHTTDLTEMESKNVMPIAHPVSTNNYDMNGVFAGAVSLVDQTDKLMWKRVRNISDSDLGMGLFSGTQISMLEDDNVNALIKKDDKYVFSNGYTGSTDSTYRWVDIIRTRNLIEDLVRNRLENLIMNSKVPYTAKGFQMVRNNIERACRTAVAFDAITDTYTNQDGETVSGYRIIMPDIRNVTESEREDRELNGVEILVKIPGHIHTISINMTIYI